MAKEHWTNEDLVSYIKENPDIDTISLTIHFKPSDKVVRALHLLEYEKAISRTWNRDSKLASYSVSEDDVMTYLETDVYNFIKQNKNKDTVDITLALGTSDAIVDAIDGLQEKGFIKRVQVGVGSRYEVL